MSYNRAIIIGRMTKTPERRATTKGTAVCNFAVAVERNFTAEDGTRKTDFLDVVAWGRTAEFVVKYFAKGQWIGIDGSIETRSYTDKEGNNRKAVEIRAERAFFVGNKARCDNDDTGHTDDTDDVVLDDTGDLPF